MHPSTSAPPVRLVPDKSAAHPGAARTLRDLLRHRCTQQEPGARYTVLNRRGHPKDLRMGELYARAQATACRLRDMGVGQGDRILLAYPPDGLEFFVGFAACLLLGAIAVPVRVPAPTRLAHELPTLAHIVNDCDAKVALTTRAYWAAAQLGRLRAGLRRFGRRELPIEWPALPWLSTDGLSKAPSGGLDLPEVRPDQVAYLQYTSGSTRSPRGVMITHDNALSNLRLIAQETEVDSTSVIVGWVPLFHDMGLAGGLLNVLYSGARLVFFSPLLFLKRPELWLQALERFGGTHTAAPDFGYQYLMARVPQRVWAQTDLSALRFVLQGGEAARAETLERLDARLALAGAPEGAFNNVYGLAESTLYVAGRTWGCARELEVSAEELQRNGVVRDAVGEEPVQRLISSGEPAPEVRVRIVHPQRGEVLPEREVGEVWVAGGSVSPGYWGKEPQRSEFGGTLVHEPHTHYLRTGDLGFMADGELYICARLKEIIIQGGRNLHPQDLEHAVVHSHPHLRKGGTAAFSVEVEGSERLVLAVEVKAELDAQRCATQAAPAIRHALYEQHQVCPHDIVFLRRGSLPKTSSGKIMRLRCRSLYLQRSFQSVASVGPEQAPKTSAQDELSLVIREQLATMLGTSAHALDPDATFEELGVDSLMRARLAEQISQRIGRELPTSLWFEHGTPARVARAISEGEPTGAEGLLTHDEHVRPASSSDLPRLTAYLSRADVDRSFNKPLSERVPGIPARVRDRAARGVWLLAQLDGEIAGCLALLPHDDGLVELSTLSVAPEARATGLAEKLYTLTLRTARARYGARTLEADSWSGNTATGAALRHLGFEEVQRFADPDKRPDGVQSVLYRKHIEGGADVAR